VKQFYNESARLGRGNGAEEVGEEAVGGGDHPGLVLDDGEAEDIEIEAEGGSGALKLSERIGERKLLGKDAGADAGRSAFGAADEFDAQVGGAGGADSFGGDGANADALDFVEADGNAHEDDDESGDFDGGVPAIEIIGGIGFGDADSLGGFDGFLEREAALHFGEDDVRGGIQDTAKAAELDGGKGVREKRKDRGAVHDRGLEEEFAGVGAGEVAEFLKSVDDRTFIGADGVGAGFERGAEMFDGGMAGVAIEGGGFEEDVGASGFKPLADVARSRPRGRIGKLMVQERGSVEAIGIGDPADAAGGDASEGPVEIVVAAEEFALGEEEAEKFLADVAEADESEIIGADGSASCKANRYAANRPRDILTNS
jgi:hypothetical protein